MFKLNQLYQYALLMRIHRPIGSLLLLWPTLMALWIASQGRPPIHLIAIFVAGVFLMRSAGCVINDYADRNFDGFVSRTKDRPLVTGKVDPKEALGLLLLLLTLAFFLVCLLNLKTIALSVVGVILACSYPFMKRYTHLPQLILGCAFSWSIPMAFCAVNQNLPTACWVLFMANLCWVMAYDTVYAMVDKKDDINIHVKSTAILFGEYDKLMVGLFHMGALILFTTLGFIIKAGLAYYLGIAGASILAIYQQKLIKNQEEKKCFQAFLNNQWFGCVLFIGTVI